MSCRFPVPVLFLFLFLFRPHPLVFAVTATKSRDGTCLEYRARCWPISWSPCTWKASQFPSGFTGRLLEGPWCRELMASLPCLPGTESTTLVFLNHQRNSRGERSQSRPNTLKARPSYPTPCVPLSVLSFFVCVSTSRSPPPCSDIVESWRHQDRVHRSGCPSGNLVEEGHNLKRAICGLQVETF